MYNRQKRGQDRVPWRSKHPLLTGHIRRVTLVDIKNIRDYPLSKAVWKRQSNKGYETKIICNRKQGRYSDRRICKMMIFNEIRYNPAT
jgi:hypothetical protein